MKGTPMTHDPLTLYKLIVLYMLDRVTFPLTKAQVGDFILEREYTNFLTLQQVIAELIDTELIVAKSHRNRSNLDMSCLFTANEMEMRNEVSVLADYYKSTSGEYEARLKAKEKDVTVVEITLSVPDEDTASAICANWQKCNQDIYQYLIAKLF